MTTLDQLEPRGQIEQTDLMLLRDENDNDYRAQISDLVTDTIAAGNTKAVTSNAVSGALADYDNSEEVSGKINDALTNYDNKSEVDEKISSALSNYQAIAVYTTNNGAFNNTFSKTGIHEIFIFDISDKNKWIKLIYSTNGTNYTITKISNRTLEINTQNAYGTIIIKDGSGNYKAVETFYN